MKKRQPSSRESVESASPESIVVRSLTHRKKSWRAGPLGRPMWRPRSVWVLLSTSHISDEMLSRAPRALFQASVMARAIEPGKSRS